MKPDTRYINIHHIFVGMQKFANRVSIVANLHSSWYHNLDVSASLMHTHHFIPNTNRTKEGHSFDVIARCNTTPSKHSRRGMPLAAKHCFFCFKLPNHIVMTAL